MSMRIDLDAKVRTSDGKDAGTIERVIFDPQSNSVREVVVDTGGLLGRRVLLPVTEIEAAARDGDAVRLGLSEADLERQPDYVPDQYATPPAGWVPPVGYGFPMNGYLWPAALVDAGPPPSDQSDVARPSDEISLPQHSAVVDRDGDDVGVVDEVRIDPATGQLMGFVLRAGGVLRTLFGGGDVVEVTRSQIDGVEQGIVRLRLSKDELEQAARGTPATRDAQVAPDGQGRPAGQPEQHGEAGIGATAGMVAGAAAGAAAGGPVGAVLGGGLGAAAGAQAGQALADQPENKENDEPERPKRSPQPER